MIGLSDSTGSITKSYAYDAFGVELNKNDADTNPWRYCGEYTDLETSSIYLRHRYYNPASGRFLTEDPIRDGLNWYGYANGNPVAFIDPLGLASYILYDFDMHIFSINGHVNQLSLALKERYGTDVHTIKTKKWSADTFKKWWNDLPNDVDAIVIASHGTFNRIQFDSKNDRGSSDANDNYGLSIWQMPGLKVKNMDMLFLMGCNVGHLDTDNMGRAFTSYIGDGGRVVAPDGEVVWFTAYPDIRNIFSGNFYAEDNIMANIKVMGGKYFKDFRESGSERDSAGFIAYYSHNGITHSQDVLRASMYSNARSVFNMIWEASRPYVNQNWNEGSN